MRSTRCPSCLSKNIESFYRVDQVPVHSCLMLDSRDDAVNFPQRNIELAFCRSCGFVSNVAFDKSVQDYTPIYEDQQSFSPTFNSFAKRLAEQLIEKYDLKNKVALEIGCGKGDFLALLCELGENSGIGIDPTCIKERINSPARDRIEVVQDYYSEKYRDYHGDMVLCRHTLEHIHSTQQFVSMVRRAIGERTNTVVFFEIPDVTIVLNDIVFWDIYYEHCSYFSPGSLARLFRSTGFEVLDVYREYDDQYLLIDAKPVERPSTVVHPLEESLEEMAASVARFSTTVRQQIDGWKTRIIDAHRSGGRIAIWGSGSKCVAFLTTLGLDEEVGCVVDINPHRHGKFIPGVGKDVKSPEYLVDYDPTLVIIMNPIYREEISDMVSKMGIQTEITTVSDLKG